MVVATREESIEARDMQLHVHGTCVRAHTGNVPAQTFDIPAASAPNRHPRALSVQEPYFLTDSSLQARSN